MLKLCLHVGTEKTGSSWLQSCAALGRARLAQHGVLFPRGTDHDEKQMRAGRISAGNAREWGGLVERDDWSGLGRRLESATSSAGHAPVSVLFSSEQLLAPLARARRLEALEATARRAGFAQVRLLLVLRDPVEQLLSLYKHRAKRGTAGPIQTWVRDGYSLPEQLAGLRAQLDDSCVELTVRKYQSGDGALGRIFFEDWLSVRVPDVEVPTNVNPSLSLSELVLVRRLAERRQELAPFLYDRLLAVDARQKARANALEDHARGVACAAVRAHQREWEHWNERLPLNEALEVPAASELPGPEPDTLTFSGAQVQALMDFLAKSASADLLAQVVWHGRLRPALGRLRRRILVRSTRT